MSTKHSFNSFEEKLLSLCCQYLSLCHSSKTFSELSIIVIFQSSFSLRPSELKWQWNCSWWTLHFFDINFWHFSSPAFIIIKTGTEWCNSTTQILLRTWFTLNQLNNHIASAVQNPFSNVKRFTFILVLKSVSFINER